MSAAPGPRVLDHLSDLHFGRADPAVVEALLGRLNADPADLVVVSGDLTQRARTGEYREARDFLGRLRAPWLAVPGNHDIPAHDLASRFLDPFGRWRRHVSIETEPVWADEALQVLGLNTVSRGGLHLAWERGRVPRGRLLRLLRRLRELPRGPFRVVVAHHPFLAPPERPDTPLVGAGERALRGLARSGVGLVLSGHLHLGYSATHGIEGGLTVLQAGSATSTRLRGEPNSYHRIVVGGGRARWVTHRWDGSAWR